MSSRRLRAPRTEVLAAYLDGDIAPSERASIEAQLAESLEARGRLAQLENIRDLLAAPIPGIESVDLTAAVRSVIAETSGQPSASKASHRVYAWSAVATAAVACAGLALARWIALPSELDGEYRAKTAAANPSDEARWSGIRIHRLVPRGHPQPLSESSHVAPHEALLFSYTNLGPAPYEYLMIFGIDASDQIRWFHPAYESATTDPVSIAIARGAADQLLPEVIEHDLAPGVMTIHALFSHEPLAVSQVEERRSAKTEAAPFRGARLQRIQLMVRP